MLKYLYDLSYGANYNIVGLLFASKIVQMRLRHRVKVIHL